MPAPFVEAPRFPESIGYGAEGGPEYQTEVVELQSGFEQRNQVWLYPRGRWSVQLVDREQVEIDELIAFVRSVAKGRANGFRFKDPLDYSVAYSTSAFSNTAPAIYQLLKKYSSGSETAYREIKKLVAGTIVVRDSLGAVRTSGVDYTLNINTGVLTVIGSPTWTPTSWQGEFDVPVRLNNDNMRLSISAPGQVGFIAGWGAVELIEVRV